MSGYSTVEVEVTVKLRMKLSHGTEVQEVIDEMDYSFIDMTGNADIEDTEVTGHEVKDSR